MFQNLLFKTTQAHHDANLVCMIGGKLIEHDSHPLKEISEDMVSTMVAGLKERFGDEINERLENVPGGPVEFHIQKNHEIFVYGLATHNILIHHSIFDGLLADLIVWIKEKEPAMFDGAIHGRKIDFSQISNMDLEAIRKPLVEKYVSGLLRESIESKVKAITACIKGELPDLKNGYRYDTDLMVEIDNRRHQIIHNPTENVKIEDRAEIADYLRNCSMAFIFYVFDKLVELDKPQ